jgi:hypothetical protein
LEESIENESNCVSEASLSFHACAVYAESMMRQAWMPGGKKGR